MGANFGPPIMFIVIFWIFANKLWWPTLPTKELEFKQEVSVCQLLNLLDNPNVALCEVYFINVANKNTHWIALNSKDASFYIHTGWASKIFLQTIAPQDRSLINTVQVMYDKNVVHMEIRADKIFIAVDNRWELGDFGSSKFIGHYVTTSSLVNYV